MPADAWRRGLGARACAARRRTSGRRGALAARGDRLLLARAPPADAAGCGRSRRRRSSRPRRQGDPASHVGNLATQHDDAALNVDVDRSLRHGRSRKSSVSTFDVSVTSSSSSLGPPLGVRRRGKAARRRGSRGVHDLPGVADGAADRRTALVDEAGATSAAARGIQEEGRDRAGSGREGGDQRRPDPAGATWLAPECRGGPVGRLPSARSAHVPCAIGDVHRSVLRVLYARSPIAGCVPQSRASPSTTPNSIGTAVGYTLGNPHGGGLQAMFFDPIYIIFVLLPTVAITGWAAWRVRSTYGTWSKVDSGINLDAFDFARRLLDRQGLTRRQDRADTRPADRPLRPARQGAARQHPGRRRIGTVDGRRRRPAARGCRSPPPPSSPTRWGTRSRTMPASRP